ncbi:MAG: HAD-IA family hydrolase [Gemmatimonadota bacterium]|nr:HAD-IA family hydrolase [Gemmatimonadota bacterium]
MPPGARPLAVLFDLDGTLIDSIELLLSSFRYAFATAVGRVPPDEAWIAGIGMPLVTQMRMLAEREADVEPLVVAYRSYQREHHDRLLREFEGARETLALLLERGHPMALVTSKIVELAVRALDFTGLSKYLDVIVGCDTCARHKPDPEPVLIAVERLGYTTSEAVFVGDSPHDIAAGNAAGVATIAALWGPFDRQTLEKAAPHHRIERITDLPPLLERVAAELAA